MNRTLITLGFLALAVAATLAAGCGGESSAPDPQQVMDRALRPDTLESSLAGATVRVESLGYEDRVLEDRLLEIPDPVVEQLRKALGDSRDGFRRLTSDLRFRGGSEVNGTATSHISGKLDTGALIRAAGRAGATGAIRPGLSAENLKRMLVGAEFDLYGAVADGTLERLDLTLSLDNPDNASPATRIRFSITGESHNSTE